MDDLERSGLQIDVLRQQCRLLCSSRQWKPQRKSKYVLDGSMYFGPLRLIRAVLPYMRSRRYGVVVNFSSGAALDGAQAWALMQEPRAGLDEWVQCSRNLLLMCRVHYEP